METSQTADYALRVLQELERDDGQTVAEIAQRLALSRSVAQRIVTTLHKKSMLLKAADGRYSLGPALILLGRNLPHELAATARPFVRSLADLAQEMVVLTVPDGDHAEVIARRNGSTAPLRVEYELGSRHLLSQGASGLAMLAYLDDPRAARSMGADGPAVLAKVRNDGFVRTEGQIKEHMTGVAAPVLTTSRGVVGSLAIIVPSARAERLDSLLPALVEVARDLGDAYEHEHQAVPAPAGKARAR